jgi:hypothetical protein
MRGEREERKFGSFSDRAFLNKKLSKLSRSFFVLNV